MTESSNLRRVRTIADYQYGKGTGEHLFPDNVEFQMSATGKVRQVTLENRRLATVRAHDGLLTLGIDGARRLHEFINYPGQRVVINSDAAPFVAKGKTAFAKHVLSVDPEIRAGEEILVVDEDDRLLAAGKAVLSASEMLVFKKGIAVDVRWGIKSGEKE